RRGRGAARRGPLTWRDTLESKAVRRRSLNSTLKSVLFWMLLIVLGALIWSFSSSWASRNEQKITFSEFLQKVGDKQVASVKITGNDITGKLVNSDTTFRTYVPAGHYTGLANELNEAGVKIEADREAVSPWATLLYSWAPILIMIGFWIFIMRQMQSGGNKALSFGKSRAKLS